MGSKKKVFAQARIVKDCRASFLGCSWALEELREVSSIAVRIQSVDWEVSYCLREEAIYYCAHHQSRDNCCCLNTVQSDCGSLVDFGYFGTFPFLMNQNGPLICFHPFPVTASESFHQNLSHYSEKRDECSDCSPTGTCFKT